MSVHVWVCMCECGCGGCVCVSVGVVGVHGVCESGVWHTVYTTALQEGIVGMVTCLFHLN